MGSSGAPALCPNNGVSRLPYATFLANGDNKRGSCAVSLGDVLGLDFLKHSDFLLNVLFSYRSCDLG